MCLSAQRSAICRTSQRHPLRRASGIGAELPVLRAPRSGQCCPFSVIDHRQPAAYAVRDLAVARDARGGDPRSQRPWIRGNVGL